MLFFEEEPLQIAGKNWTAQEVVEALSPFATEERLQKFQQVVQHRTYNVAPVLEHIYDRGNISAVMRSAEAFGFMNFHIVENPGDRFKAANRVTQGTDKWLHIQKYKTSQECVGKLKSQGFKIFATHLEASRPIDELDFSTPTAIVFGNEKVGVSAEMLDMVDGSVIIPMYGFAQSFNISVAAALSLYHIHQQRKAQLGQSGDLNEKQKELLLATYLFRSLDSAESILRNKL